MKRSDRIAYFGKLPSRPDFIKDAPDLPLMSALDNWLAQVMSLLPANARWKIDYDAMPPMHFAFVGNRRHHAIAGHLVASRDAAGRRFPFMLTRTVEVDDPAQFLAQSPLVFAQLWTRLAPMAQELLSASNPATRLQAIAATDIALGDAAHAYGAQTIGGLSAHLPSHDLKLMVLALGLLLQPVISEPGASLDKSLVLPLPTTELMRPVAAWFWLQLIQPFLLQGDFEIAQFHTQRAQRPVMVLGFCGAAAHTLHAIIDPLAGESEQLSFEALDWVHTYVAQDPRLRQLANYLDQPSVTLKLARDLFVHAFLEG